MKSPYDSLLIFECMSKMRASQDLQIEPKKSNFSFFGLLAVPKFYLFSVTAMNDATTCSNADNS